MALRFIPIVLFSLFALTACNPRDPEVLSAAERACANDRNKCPKFQTNNKVGKTERPAFPEKLEVVAANYMLQREEQVVTVLRLAEDILNDRLQTTQCFVVTELKPEGNVRHFYLESRYPYCFYKYDNKVEVKQKGRLLLSLEADDTKLMGLKLQSETLADGSSSYKASMFRNGSRRSFEIQENLKLELFRVGEGSVSKLQLAEYKSDASIDAIEFNEVKEQHRIVFQSWGEFALEDRGGTTVLKPALSSTLSQQATSSGGKSWYDMILSPTQAVGPGIKVNELVLEECGNSQGSRELRFDFIKEQSRFKNILTYSSSELQIEDPKGEKKTAKMKRYECAKATGGYKWFGLTAVTWDRLVK